MKFNLTPLIVFLIILAILILSVVFGDKLNNYTVFGDKEGFISFNQSVTAGGDPNIIAIPYSAINTIHKVYDSIYFDQKNGNTVQFFGTQYDGTTSDLNGSSLTFVGVIPRSGNPMGNYPITLANPTGVPVSVVGTTLPSANLGWVYPSAATFSTVLPYQIIYIAHNEYTIIHIYDIANRICHATFSYNGAIGNTKTYSIGANISPHIPNAYITESASNENRLLSPTAIPTYSTTQLLHSISENVMYDSHNGYLVISSYGGETAGKSLTVYNGSNTPQKVIAADSTEQYTPPVFNSGAAAAVGATSSWMVEDLLGGNMVLVVPYPEKTFILVLSPDKLNPQLMSIRNVVTFTGSAGTLEAPTATTPGNIVTTIITTPTTGTHFTPVMESTIPPSSGTESSLSIPSSPSIPPIVGSTQPSTSSPYTNPSTSTNPGGNPNMESVAITAIQALGPGIISALNNTYSSPPAARAGCGVSGESLDEIIGNYYKNYWYDNAKVDAGQKYSSDFMLKTQAIPPICPACPSCPKMDTSANTDSVCSNCGGNGGSGTKTDAGQSIYTAGPGIDLNRAPMITGSTGAVYDATGRIIGNTVHAAENSAGAVYDATGRIMGNTVHAAENSAGAVYDATGRVVGNTLNAVENTAGAVYNTTGNIVGGTVGAVTNTANAIYTTAGSIANSIVNPRYGSSGQGYTSGNGNQGYTSGNGNDYPGRGMAGNYNGDVQDNKGYAGTKYGGYGYPPTNVPDYVVPIAPITPDNYRGGGSAPSNSSTFLPVTADFSSFGR
jgi:hypothetical protein